MGIPLRQQIRVGAYVLKQRLLGRARYPLVLMLEPLFRCNLACAGCGKIDYPTPILNRRLSVQECLDAADECGAPVVSIPGGEPLIHKDIGAIVKGLIARGKFVYLCTNALLVEKKIDLFEPEPLSHLLDPSGRAARASRPLGLPGRRVRSRRRGDPAAARARLSGQRQRHAVRRRRAGRRRRLLRLRDRRAGRRRASRCRPATPTSGRPTRQHFLNRRKTKELFRAIFRRGQRRRAGAWQLSHSSLYLDFLAGNQQYRCTPWGNPTRNVFGWQRPCYLLAEGYAASFKELMERDRLGQLRHRQLREMRRLHGALRL